MNNEMIKNIHVSNNKLRLVYLSFQTCKDTKDIGSLQKAADFVRAFTLGFEVDVSIVRENITLLETILYLVTLSNVHRFHQVLNDYS